MANRECAVLLDDPPRNESDGYWRSDVSLEEEGVFRVYPIILLGDFGLSAPLDVAQTVGIGTYGFTAPVNQIQIVAMAPFQLTSVITIGNSSRFPPL